MKKLKWEEAKKQINTGTVFLTFTTEWCGDCKMMKPVIKELEEKIKEKRNDVTFIEVDAEEANLFRSEEEFKVRVIPSYYKIVDGKKEHIGYEYVPMEKFLSHF